MNAFRKARQRRAELFSQLVRLVYYRLVVPIRREKRGPAVIARGAAIGIFVGLTPTVGVQIPVVLALWWTMRRLGWHFSLVLALAWTWISNAANVVPLYYLYYQTGALILRNRTGGAQAFAQDLERGAGSVENFTGALHFLLHIMETAGANILIGCLPYALSLSAVGYWGTFVLAKGYQTLRAKRQSGKLLSEQGTRASTTDQTKRSPGPPPP